MLVIQGDQRELVDELHRVIIARSMLMILQSAALKQQTNITHAQCFYELSI